MGFHSSTLQPWKTVGTVAPTFHHHTPYGVWGSVGNRRGFHTRVSVDA